MTFVCIACSWYHSLGVYSFLVSHLLDGGEVKKIIILKGGFLGKDADILDFQEIFNNECEVRVVQDWGSLKKELLNDKKKGGRDFYLLSPNSHPYRAVEIFSDLGLTPFFVEIEEGIGSYGGTLQYFSAVCRESKNKLAAIKACATYFPKKIYVSKKVTRKKRWLNFNDKLEVDNDVVSSYKKAINRINSYKSNIGFSIEINDSIYFSSPVVELGMIGEEKYMNELGKIFPWREGVVIKPHPAESLNKYLARGYHVCSTEVKGEELLSVLPMTCKVYCSSSTIAYTAKLFFNHDVRRLVSVDFFYRGFGKKQRQIMDSCTASPSSV